MSPQNNTAATRGPNISKSIRVDLQLIADLVPAGARVLDVGCSDGTLLDYLTRHKNVDGRGIELDRDRVAIALNQGLSVIQGDAEVDLPDYPDQGFDCVVLSQTLQAVHNPKWMLEQLLRISTHAVVSITNAGYWKNRAYLLFAGREPFAVHPDETWFNTAYIHPCTIRDFVALARDMNIRIEKCFIVGSKGNYRQTNPDSCTANLFAVQAVFLLG
ncbi:MAG: methionine biosynthesis protein MetW [Alphaproteobacteria bacterium]|jgi:methionine biosynthesis protein MetW